MGLSKVLSTTVYGIDAVMITIEVAVGQGTKFFMVGLPDSAVKESQQRIETAIKHFGYHMPRQKIVVNLAPANIKKEGSSYDLPIALGILQASEQLVPKISLTECITTGELSLDGQLRPIRGVLSMAVFAKKRSLRSILLPSSNAEEAAVVDNLDVIGIRTLKEAIDHLEGRVVQKPFPKVALKKLFQVEPSQDLDFGEVQGQESTKKALEIAAAGGHNMIMVGAPGSGKTMLAKRMSSILPPLSLEESLETTKVHSVAGHLKEASLVRLRPFRAPHHTISDVALVGGGTHPHPGEISLAHHGILFLDELPEFKRSVLEVLRQPLEERNITISRAKVSVSFPANFMLIASMNPCPCGYYTHPTKDCQCSSHAVDRYMSKISGPLMDRIDIHIEVRPVPFTDIQQKRRKESAEIRARVLRARTIQASRYSSHPGIFTNSMLTPSLLQEYCQLDPSSHQLLKRAMEKLNLSTRAYDRILKIARSIADLEEKEQIATQHIAQAVNYRNLDRKAWMNS